MSRRDLSTDRAGCPAGTDFYGEGIMPESIGEALGDRRRDVRAGDRPWRVRRNVANPS
jgi:hypothetical protein